MIAEFIHKTLTPTIAPMIYVMMGASVFIGFAFATGFFMSGTESVLWNTGVLVHRELWGTILFFTATIAEVGFLTNNDGLISLGGVCGFMAWTFATISVALAGHWYILVSVCLLHLLFHGYVVLATALGYIRRQPTQ